MPHVGVDDLNSLSSIFWTF